MPRKSKRCGRVATPANTSPTATPTRQPELDAYLTEAEVQHQQVVLHPPIPDATSTCDQPPDLVVPEHLAKFKQDTVTKAVGQALMAQVVGMSDTINPTNLNDIGEGHNLPSSLSSDCMRGTSLPTTLPLNIATGSSPPPQRPKERYFGGKCRGNRSGNNNSYRPSATQSRP